VNFCRDELAFSRPQAPCSTINRGERWNVLQRSKADLWETDTCLGHGGGMVLC